MKHHFHTAVVAAVIAAGVAFLLPQRAETPAPAAAQKESAYDRVMRTGTIRCGYGLWQPMLMKDANTGAMSGTWVDVTEALAKAMELKVDWASEVSMATYLEDMKNGRFDVECGGGWPNAIRGKFAEYSRPAFYFAIYPIVRADDMRFDGHYENINAADVRVVTMDGETSVQLRDELFPKSVAYNVAPASPIADMALAVLDNKADVVLLSSAELEEYNRQNPGKLKAAVGEPLRIIPQSYSVASGEVRLQNMLNTALEQLLNDGTIERIIKAHEQVPGTYLRVAKPYLN